MDVSNDSKPSDEESKACRISSTSKRRTSITTVAEMLRNSRTKNMKIDGNPSNANLRIAPKSEPDYKETIIYDEYLERGIPDKLLEGLGLNQNTNEPEPINGFEEEKEEIVTRSSCANSKDGAVASTAFCMLTPIPMVLLSSGGFLSTALQDQIPEASKVLPQLGEETILENRSISCSRNRLAANSVTKKPTHSRQAHRNHKQPLAPLLPQPSPTSDAVHKASTKSPQKTGVLPHYAIKKGGVMYEYTPSGAVLASIIRDDVATPDKRSLHGRGLSRKSSTPTTTDSKSLPSESLDDCGFDPMNVENLLDDLYKEMESMRRSLSSMKDDLRRVGVKADVKPDAQCTKEQSEKAAEVSVRIQRLYTEHVKLLERVENSKQTTGSTELDSSDS